MRGRYRSARSVIAILLIVSILCGFAYELYDIQIKNHEYFASQNNTKKTYTVPIEAARGEIVDRNGNPLVTNRQGNSIVLDAAYFPQADNNLERNRIVLDLIKLFRHNDEEFANNLPLKLDKNGQVQFYTKKDDKDFEKNIEIMKSADMFNLQPYATAQNCFDAMVEKYGLETFDKETALLIGNVRYELTRMLFSVTNPVTIADDVSDKTVAEIMENGTKYLGATVKVVAYREYADSTLAPHIIGTVRKINAEEYLERKDMGYSITDEIGESGIEAACEDDLRGTPGEKTVTIDNEGNVTEEITKEPVQGDTIVLTIDKNLQALAQKKLSKICRGVSTLSTGAVVVENCNNGEILAAANYPSFDLNEYYKHYDKLAKDKQKPLYNRFALGAYAPGSTFKPLMGVAALEENEITPYTYITCAKKIKVNEMEFKCAHRHDSLNVQDALEKSCNIFFYTCAMRLGIERMNEYGEMFGLGLKTGVEIPEANGILAGPEYRKKFDQIWAPGDTVQAGIGQSDNLFTPLQLANYAGIIANGGTRYKLHFVKSKIAASTGAVSDTGAVIMQESKFSDTTLYNIREGMHRVSTVGSPSKVFNSIETSSASKTGTSQVIVDGIKHNNGFLITYAPYENPEISIASAIELAGSGSSTAEITASIIDYYYSHNTDEKRAQPEGILL